MPTILLYDDGSSDCNVTVANKMLTGIGFNVNDGFKNRPDQYWGFKVYQRDLNEDGSKKVAEATNSWDKGESKLTLKRRTKWIH